MGDDEGGWQTAQTFSDSQNASRLPVLVIYYVIVLSRVRELLTRRYNHQ